MNVPTTGKCGLNWASWPCFNVDIVGLTTHHRKPGQSESAWSQSGPIGGQDCREPDEMWWRDFTECGRPGLWLTACNLWSNICYNVECLSCESQQLQHSSSWHHQTGLCSFYGVTGRSGRACVGLPLILCIFYSTNNLNLSIWSSKSLKIKHDSLENDKINRTSPSS